MLPEEGSLVYIQSFKHDGSLHRTWCKGFVLKSTPEEIVAVTNKAWVIEADGRRWFTREPAVCFFWPDRWYNVISMIRKSGIYYYCNLASPSLYDGEAIKNIDYDLDVKLYPDRSYEILDEGEYRDHAAAMHYPPEVCRIVEAQMKELIMHMEHSDLPFTETCIHDWYNRYLEMSRTAK